MTTTHPTGEYAAFILNMRRLVSTGRVPRTYAQALDACYALLLATNTTDLHQRNKLMDAAIFHAANANPNFQLLALTPNDIPDTPEALQAP